MVLFFFNKVIIEYQYLIFDLVLIVCLPSIVADIPMSMGDGIGKCLPIMVSREKWWSKISLAMEVLNVWMAWCPKSSRVNFYYLTS